MLKITSRDDYITMWTPLSNFYSSLVVQWPFVSKETLAIKKKRSIFYGELN